MTNDFYKGYGSALSDIIEAMKRESINPMSSPIEKQVMLEFIESLTAFDWVEIRKQRDLSNNIKRPILHIVK